MLRPTTNAQAACSLIYFLTKTLDIPSPRLPILCSSLPSYADQRDLIAAIATRWATEPVALPPSATHYLTALQQAHNDDNELAFFTTLLAVPLNLLTSHPHLFHSQWCYYLNHRTGAMSSSLVGGAQRHVIHLGLNTSLVKLAVTYHLTTYASRFHPSADIETHHGTDPPVPGYNDLDESVRQWTRKAWKDHALTTSLHCSDYNIDYVTTSTTGWPFSFDEVYGNNTAFLAFLATAAPHCHPIPSLNRRGTGTVIFVHELTHRSELFQLQGKSSPQHGITRPINVTFHQLKAATTCCSQCGEKGHRGKDCKVEITSSLPADDSMTDSSLPDSTSPDSSLSAPSPSGPLHPSVCHTCYSPDHQSCHLPPHQLRCKVCDGTGHTSWRCAQYKPRYVLLSPPRVSRPPNPRTLDSIRRQISRPVSWSEISAGLSRAPPTLFPSSSLPTTTALPQPSPLPPTLASHAAFPPLPSAPLAPASATDSCPSSPAPATPVSTASSSPSNDSMFQLILEMQRSMQRMQEDNQRAQREMQEDNKRTQHEMFDKFERAQNRMMDFLSAFLKPQHNTPLPPFLPNYAPQQLAVYPSSATPNLAPFPTLPAAHAAPTLSSTPNTSPTTSIHVPTTQSGPTTVALNIPIIQLNTPPSPAVPMSDSSSPSSHPATTSAPSPPSYQ